MLFRSLGAVEARPGEALLAFGPSVSSARNLSPSGDLTEAAANLFAYLRALDRPEHSAIAVMPIPEEGLGRAINDRLRRAAAPGRSEELEHASEISHRDQRHRRTFRHDQAPV